VRDGQEVVTPAAAEVLRAGDVLALAGSHEAIASATHILQGRP
jgi:K+/H+ antiporter YhaU regulatory subunit KhtT